MKTIGTFDSKRWGTITVVGATYRGPYGPLAVLLNDADGMKLANLSVNMYLPECSHDSIALPPDHFYAKTWAENEDLAVEAMASGLFEAVDSMPSAQSGFIIAPVWRLKP